MNQNNISSEVVKQYRQKSVSLKSLDVAFIFMKPHFSQEKRSYERYRLIPKLEHEEDKINELNQYLTEKWDLLIRLFNHSFTCFLLKYNFIMLNKEKTFY